MWHFVASLWMGPLIIESLIIEGRRDAPSSILEAEEEDISLEFSWTRLLFSLLKWSCWPGDNVDQQAAIMLAWQKTHCQGLVQSFPSSSILLLLPVTVLFLLFLPFLLSLFFCSPFLFLFYLSNNTHAFRKEFLAVFSGYSSCFLA